MDQTEEMTERSPDPSGVGIECGKSTFDEGTEKPSFRVGEGIAIAMARLDNEEMVHFLPQKSAPERSGQAKIKRAGYTFKYNKTTET